MGRVKVLSISGKEIISVDYAGCDSKRMIKVFDEARDIVAKSTGGCLILTNFDKAFITRSFLQHVEPEMQRLKHLIKKNAFIGMSLPQRLILKGFVLFIGSESFVSFASQQEAIDYLLSESD